ncbi:FAD-dependent oxidoreductase [Pontiella agarivorans]|uniref:FAD-dependent oxidoreductase n=1 Tax=Pontiella agarivorans TaxID=3038953 RepID=A0ABU5MTS1_9BACT|nr:FAD-dependent oxidoreductase [Pontiella agarivorans]MDZ8117606.1 FAD-dependent oxidoreductase [Pontiella agarivorans]
MADNKKQVVVIGNGMAGYRFCEKLLEYDAHHQYAMTVLGDEPVPAYDRVSLSTLFSGRRQAELYFAEQRWYDYYKIDLNLGSRAVSVDRKAKSVTAEDGTEYSYDKLVIATGSRPIIPAIGNTALGGVHVYRTAADVKAIREEARNAKNAVVIGGGLLGLEIAEACREMGLETTILEREKFLMPEQLDEMAGKLLDMKIEELGIHLKLGAHVQSLKGESDIERVVLDNGDVFDADLVVVTAGITPNDEIGTEAGLERGARGGIAIGKTTQTSDPDIYAIGECAAFKDTLFGLVAPCYAMAETCAAHLGGINKTFALQKPASKLKLLDLQVASIGNIHLPEDGDVDYFYDQDIQNGVYKKLLISKDWKTLYGAILVGEFSEFERLRKYIEKGLEMPDHPRELLAPIGRPIELDIELEDDDLVCFCNHVTKGDICKAIDAHNLKDASGVMATTYAAGLCGGCYDTVVAVTKQYIEHGV